MSMHTCIYLKRLCVRIVIAGTLFVMFHGAGWPSLFLLPFMELGVSTECLQCVQGQGSYLLYVTKNVLA